MLTIYERLGDDNLRLLVDTFYDFVFEHEEIKDLFQNDKTEIKDKQYLFLTQFLGGPGRYTEKHGHPRLRMRHMPHKITYDATMAWLECMAKAINTLPIEDEFKDEIFQRFPKPAAHMMNTQ